MLISCLIRSRRIAYNSLNKRFKPVAELAKRSSIWFNNIARCGFSKWYKITRATPPTAFRVAFCPASVPRHELQASERPPFRGRATEPTAQVDRAWFTCPRRLTAGGHHLPVSVSGAAERHTRSWVVCFRLSWADPQEWAAGSRRRPAFHVLKHGQAVSQSGCPVSSSSWSRLRLVSPRPGQRLSL